MPQIGFDTLQYPPPRTLFTRLKLYYIPIPFLDHILIRLASKPFFHRPYLRQYVFAQPLFDLIALVYSCPLATQLRLYSIAYSDSPRAQLLCPPRPRLLLSLLPLIPR
jgi:hypothetical protein